MRRKKWHDNYDDERVDMVFNTIMMIVGIFGLIGIVILIYY